MTDSTQEPGKTPESSPNHPPIEVNSNGEAAAVQPEAAPPAQPTAEQPTSEYPATPRAADNQPTEVLGDTAAPQHQAPPAAAHTEQASHDAQNPTAAAHPQAAHPQAAHGQPAAPQPYPQQGVPPQGYAQQAPAGYATDAFGRPIPGPNGTIYAPTPAQQAYAAANGYPAGPQPKKAKQPKDPNRRKGGAVIIAALAIGALVGGASSAGVWALVGANQGNGIPTSQAQGPSTVVVNDTDSVNEITAVAAKASPSVVTIEVASGSSGGTGSGVIISDDGYVLTNTHVVTLDGAVADAAIQVKDSSGKLYSATLVGTDPVSDLAVIKLTDASDLPAINFADSAKLNVGDTAIAIGAPLGLSGTVTNGIVSALNRSITVASSAAPDSGDQTTPDDSQQSPWNFDIPSPDGSESPGSQATSSISLSVIQTDAAINPGNSGGALLNSKGELIGVNVAIANAGGSSSSAAGSIGVGFSIPSNLAKRISDEIIETGSATHGLLGASVSDASTAADSTTVGALISDVSSGGAAAQAGLAKGDVVTNVNNIPITDATDLTAQVRSLAAGADAEITYVRDGKSFTVSVTLGELTS